MQHYCSEWVQMNDKSVPFQIRLEGMAAEEAKYAIQKIQQLPLFALRLNKVVLILS